MMVLGLGKGHCFSPVVIGVDLGIACVDCVIAFFAFCQLWRIHSRSRQLGWTRQKSPLAKPGSSISDSQARCLPFHYFHVGSRQRIVVLAVCFISALMIVVAILIGVGGGTAYSELIPKIYVSLLAIVVLVLGGALAYYGFLICSRMRRVRSESASSEMWKVGGLSVVSPLCFTTSSVIALLPDSLEHSNAYLPVLPILYYFIGSSIPSAFLLWVMRELPQPISPAIREEQETIAFISDVSVSVHHPPWRTTALSSQNQVLRSSPI